MIMVWVVFPSTHLVIIFRNSQKDNNNNKKMTHTLEPVQWIREIQNQKNRYIFFLLWMEFINKTPNLLYYVISCDMLKTLYT